MAAGKPGKNNGNRRKKSLEKFQCRRCGRCCTGHGYVNLEEGECEKIAEFLQTPLKQFQEEFTHTQSGYARWLVDGEGDDEPCVFLERDGGNLATCSLQGEVKPLQCRTFPTKWRIRGFEKWCSAFQEDDK